jgi:hypothetical protein
VLGEPCQMRAVNGRSMLPKSVVLWIYRHTGSGTETESSLSTSFTLNIDAQAMEEIHHFVLVNDKGQGVSKQRINKFASQRVRSIRSYGSLGSWSAAARYPA